MKNLKIGPKLITMFYAGYMSVQYIWYIGGIFFALVRSELQQSSCGNGFSQGDIGSFDTYLNKGSAVVRDIVLLTEEKEIQKFPQRAGTD